MSRALHLFPAFSPASGVQAFRAKYDPLAGCIPPHLTLLFPFDDPMSDRALIAHIEAIVRTVTPFSLGFSAPVVVEDQWIWLPVHEQRSAVELLHARLYTGAMEKHLRRDLPYRPHVTLGRVGREDLAQAMHDAKTLTLESAYRVERVVVETIGPGQQCEVLAEIALG